MKYSPIIFSLFDSDDLAGKIAKKLNYEMGKIILHQFPDEETVVQFANPVTNRELIFITSLDRPNTKILPLIFSAETARELGAKKIILVAPYLAYMRQDKQFEPGQGITSTYFAKLISHYFDGLITIDPHLHRWHALSEIYSIPTQTLHEIQHIARWIQEHIHNPVLIGPDAESRQWVSEIAKQSHAPCLILEKVRKGDRSIEVSIPDLEHYQNCIPVLVDDIISTGMTLRGTIQHLQTLHMKPPVCIGIHAVFAENAYQELLTTRIERIITCNTIKHTSNEIDVSGELSAIIQKSLLQQ